MNRGALDAITPAGEGHRGPGGRPDTAEGLMPPITGAALRLALPVAGVAVTAMTEVVLAVHGRRFAVPRWQHRPGGGHRRGRPDWRGGHRRTGACRAGSGRAGDAVRRRQPKYWPPDAIVSARHARHAEAVVLVSGSPWVFDHCMAQPWKGPRPGFQLRWSTDVRQMARTHAEAAGLTVTDYLIELIRRDEMDADGRPLWAPAQPRDQLPMELTA